ncbi:hypothetical protein ACEZDB_15440 [Streptacidiphilus sp. N1-3]|uniref:Integral membrane protein n=1 Tax=Streptacidiphilus alkalitolerans TaxID=3342712 RepID=A0ABV6X1G2_9ACTN
MRMRAVAEGTGVSVDLLHDSGRTALLFMLVAFVVTFVVTRVVVRLIRSGRGPFANVSVDGLHIHHLVPGIFVMLIASCAEFLLVPHGLVRDGLAAAFGMGAALTLDEFALWLHLDDVYWAQEGRKSVDAVVFVAGLGVLGLVASNPLAREPGEGTPFFVGFLVLNLLLALVAILKGRLLLGVGGVLVPFLALIALVRLARPGSVWFRTFYPPGSSKRARALRRAQRRGGMERVKGALSGVPTPSEATGRPPVEEGRQRAED